MDNRIYFRFEGKSFDITLTFSRRGIWFVCVERSKFHFSRMVLSREALLWISRKFREASIFKGRVYKTWKCREGNILVLFYEIQYFWLLHFGYYCHR